MIHPTILSSEIVTLERKIELLLDKHTALQEELSRVKQENEELKLALTSKEEELTHFKKSIKISKLAQLTVADHSETTEVKRTINEYIKKIDKCIAHLSQ
ncbi:hypothetical protein [Tunicatimonas pelagia]|uniref:hypothetical protein n=1 Tax=Tunicatimonas pelagia TaxID=931531 RepID=UPI0026663951|nr:hypothetical protein [Tunicatimonas pelagia]WKN45725.1 hypothetical protein P0M28_12230 [Tunicatimonas pelagia]